MLKSKGLTVYCNVCGNQKIIKGTLPLSCSVQQLYAIVSRADIVISIRSGILDYIVSQCKKIIAIYEDEGFYHFYSLDAWKAKAKIYEIRYKNDNQALTEIKAIIDDSSSN